MSQNFEKAGEAPVSAQSSKHGWLPFAAQICRSIAFALCGGCIGSLSFLLMEPNRPFAFFFPVITTFFGVAAGIGLSLPFVSSANVATGFLVSITPIPMTIKSRILNSIGEEDTSSNEESDHGLLISDEWLNHLLDKVATLVRGQPVDFGNVVSTVREILTQNGYFHGSDKKHENRRVQIVTLQVIKIAYAEGLRICWYQDDSHETALWHDVLQRIIDKWPIASPEPPPFGLLCLAQKSEGINS